MLSIVFRLSAALIPAIALVFFFWKSDKFPEPPKIIIITFVLGIVSIIPAIILECIVDVPINLIHNPYYYGFFRAFLGAAIPEELVKFLVIYYYCFRKPCFDEKMDGLVYGATASLGFAAFENILYVFSYGYGIAVVRALTSVPCHAIFGMNTGYYVAKSRYGKAKNKSIIIIGLIISILLHGLYDLPLMVSEQLDIVQSGTLAVRGLLFLVFIAILIFIIIYGIVILIKIKKEQSFYTYKTL